MGVDAVSIHTHTRPAVASSSASNTEQTNGVIMRSPRRPLVFSVFHMKFRNDWLSSVRPHTPNSAASPEQLRFDFLES